MKISCTLLTSVILVSSVGCFKLPETKTQTFDPEPYEVLKLIEKMGGSPGRVQFNSSMAEKNDTQFNIKDSHITVHLVAGKDREGKSTDIAEKDYYRFMVVKDLDSSQIPRSENKTVLNFGCDLTWARENDLISDDAVEIPTIPEQNEKDQERLISMQRKADTILICGNTYNQKEFRSFSLKTQLAAGTIVLKDATIELSTYEDAFSLATEKLQLFGENKIRATGPSSDKPVLPAATVELESVKEITGDGKLFIESIGGDNLSGANTGLK